MKACRIKGCVAFGADAPSCPSRICLDGVCRTHQRFSEHDLRLLLKRETGMVAPLVRCDVGIEYERRDGTRYGIDRDGRYYDVPESTTSTKGSL